MTDSMNFGPEWLRNLSSESSGGGNTSTSRYQLAEHRYGREEMLALYDKTQRPPQYLCVFPIYSEKTLPPLALTPATEEERIWQQPRTVPPNVSRGRGGSLERGRGSRGRGTYQTYGRSYDGSGVGWGNGEQSDWSPRKDYNNARSMSAVDNWRRHRGGDEEDGWRSANAPRGMEKWGRSTSWREGDPAEERNGPPERGQRGWHRGTRGTAPRRTWDDENLPEWATENMTEGGGTFDASGAFHGSDDEQIGAQSEGRGGKQLLKSTSQQNINSGVGKGGSSLPLSRSAVSLSKAAENGSRSQERITNVRPEENDMQPAISATLASKERPEPPERQLMREVEEPPKIIEKITNNNTTNGYVQEDISEQAVINRAEEDFDKIQEDLVLKLVVDEEVPKMLKMSMNVPPTTQPPPNLAPPVQDKWYYQDPQGDMQGPFMRSEMADWYRHGYFQLSLMVRRQCDDHFYMLADLIKLCNAENPFESNVRFAPVKMESGGGGPPPPKLMHEQPDNMLQYQLLQQQLRQAAAVRALGQSEPWTGLSPLQQRDLITQHMMAHPQVNPSLQYLQQQQQQQPTNPLMHMINQMQQANKLPGPTLPEKPPNPQIPSALDPIQALVQQMGGLQSLQNRLPGALGTPGLPATLSSDLPGLQGPAGLGMPNLQAGMPPELSMMPGGGLPPRPTPLGAVDPLSSTENDPIKSLLRQLQQKPVQQQPPQLDTLWQQNQFAAPPNQSHWQQSDAPISMWDMQPPPVAMTAEQPPATVADGIPIAAENDHLTAQKDGETNVREMKKRREHEEKQHAKKELEERRKQEQRKQEAERKAAEEKRKKEDERLRRELERAKKEAEDKRLRELDEKRRLKDQRKAEELARLKADEQKRLEEEEERLKREAREREEQIRKQAEANKQMQENLRLAKAAPWSKSGTTSGTSLEEIQKAEKLKKAEQQAMTQKRTQQQQELQQTVEKANPSQFKWANKPLEPRKVKSLVEIQAEEHEQLVKQMAEARLMQQKDKEVPIVSNAGIWGGSNLTWANNTSQWSNNAGGFWDEVSSTTSITSVPQPKAKSPQVLKSVSSSAVSNKQKQSKSKAKREEQQVMKVFNNGPVTDEFTEWCIKALKDINSSVDVPTFVSFLRDIESAMEIRDYCKEYLGEGPTMQHFANEFLEKRRSYKPKTNAHKDDMCSPAPALTPSTTQHSNEFQEVKGKSKKSKKSKMTKVDSRILGFSVTAAQDRINVGDLDRVDM